MTRKFELIPFHNQHFIAANDGEKIEVAIKPMIEAMGLTWHGQFQRIKRHPVLNKGIRIIGIPSAGGEQETVVMDLKMLPGMLIGISPNSIKNEKARNQVILYQEEAFDVLYNHFFGPFRPSHNQMSDIERRLTTTQAMMLYRMYQNESVPDHRQFLYNLMSSAVHALGVPMPAYVALAHEQAGVQLFLSKFWEATSLLGQKGYDWQHSRTNHLMAINLPQLRGWFADEGIDIILDRADMAALRLSQNPQFIAEKAVNCSDGRVRQCWVFANAPLLEILEVQT